MNAARKLFRTLLTVRQAPACAGGCAGQRAERRPGPPLTAGGGPLVVSGQAFPWVTLGSQQSRRSADAYRRFSAIAWSTLCHAGVPEPMWKRAQRADQNVVSGTRGVKASLRGRVRWCSMEPLRIYLEIGKRWVFASAVDWPGWSRRGKGEEAAINTLLEYAERYAKAAALAVPIVSVEVVGRVATRSGMADFGAPGAVGPWDDEPLTPKELGHHLGLLEASWAYLDAVAAASAAELRKGPRGGGRDRDAMLRHVREAERAYAPKVGCRVPPRTPWEQQRAMIVAGLQTVPPDSAWPVRYAFRRLAWHILDHAWEMEDRSC